MKNWRVSVLLLLYLTLQNSNVALAQTPPVWQNYLDAHAKGTQAILPDYSYSGYHFSEKNIPDVSSWTYFDVTNYGAIADDAIYDDAGIQAAIDAAEASGTPAVVFFPPGKFIVSSDNDINNFIFINADSIVLKGSGSETGGTEIFMDKKRVSNGHWQFRFQPESTNTSTLATITEPAIRGDFAVSVSSTSKLSKGQSVYISHKSEEFARAHYDDLELNETEWTRLFGEDGGMTVYECHIIYSIKGNEVIFKNPIQTDLPTLSESFSIKNLKTIQEVGIEDILFTSGWLNYEDDFVHHQDDIVDYGWNAVQFKFVENAWIRNCEFKDWTQVADIRESIGITVEDCILSGKRGHASFIARRNYGVLVKDCIDNANHHHGPGTGYSGVSTVYLRYKMSENQAIDSHSGSPYVTLMDDIDGGDFHTNGGPWVSYPHHGRYLTFWNFIHKKTSDADYNFWSVGTRKPATYAEPFFIGFQPNRTVTMIGEGLNEMQGVEVEPKSLFEAQLELRLNPALANDEIEYREDDLKIYPNPFSNSFQIHTSYLSDLESIDMYSIDGLEIEIKTKKNGERLLVEPLSNLSSGVYFVLINNNGRVKNYTIIKK